MKEAIKKRVRQAMDNRLAYEAFNDAYTELPSLAYCKLNKKQMREAGAIQLNTCQAWVWETPKYHMLQSYETFIACIPKYRDQNCYDVLRTEYKEHVSTSSKHIAKFMRMYGANNKITARRIEDDE